MVGWSVLIILVLAVLVTAVKKSYEGYKVYNVVLKTKDDVNILEEIQSDGIFAPWEEQFSVHNVAKLMVSKGNQPVFLEKMSKAGIEAIEIIADLQKAIDDQLRPATVSRIKRNVDSHLSITWLRYNTLEQIYWWLDELAWEYPDIVTTVEMGYSVEGRPIKGVIIEFKPGIADRKIGMLEGGIHAREWISPSTVTWIIKEFLTSTNDNVRFLAESFEWHIFPVVNPDGYAYTFTDNRFWRKNRNTSLHRNTCGFGYDNDESNGVDLNRNFGHLWMIYGASSDPCSDVFAGSAAFSEPESKSIADYVVSLNRHRQFLYYLAFHSYSQVVLLPSDYMDYMTYYEDVNEYTNIDDLVEIGNKAAKKLFSNFGTRYAVGEAHTVLYAMTGTSIDWVKFLAKVPVVYLLEMRDQGDFGFLLPPELIIPNNIEVMDFLLEMDKVTRSLDYYKSENYVPYSANQSKKLVCSIILKLFAQIFINFFK